MTINPIKGQTMILTVIVMSGTLLSLALIGGIIMLYQIRQAGDFMNSAKAVFAADAGVNWWSFSKSPAFQNPPIPPQSSATVNNEFTNQAHFEITELPNGSARVVGVAGNSKRAFLASPVCAGNTAPTVNIAPDQTFHICSGQNICLPVNGTDPDGNLSDCEHVDGLGTYTPISPGQGEWCFAPLDSGIVQPTFECYDTCGADSIITRTYTLILDPC